MCQEHRKKKLNSRNTWRSILLLLNFCSIVFLLWVQRYAFLFKKGSGHCMKCHKIKIHFIVFHQSTFLSWISPEFHLEKKKELRTCRNSLIFSVDQPGLEPGTSRLWVCCSNQLSYKSEKSGWSGASSFCDCKNRVFCWNWNNLFIFFEYCALLFRSFVGFNRKHEIKIPLFLSYFYQLKMIGNC